MVETFQTLFLFFVRLINNLHLIVNLVYCIFCLRIGYIMRWSEQKSIIYIYYIYTFSYFYYTYTFLYNLTILSFAVSSLSSGCWVASGFLIILLLSVGILVESHCIIYTTNIVTISVKSRNSRSGPVCIQKWSTSKICKFCV